MKVKRLFLKILCVACAVLMILPYFKDSFMGADKVLADDLTCKAMLGVNLEGLADYMSGDMFVDVMKVSRNWGNANSPWDEASQKSLKVDGNGWPLEDAGVVVLTASKKEDGTERNISGTYKLSFEGSATIKPVAFQFTISNQKVVNGITTADIIVPSGQSSVMMSFTNTVNANSSTGKGIKNVKMIKPGYQADEYGNYPTFTKEFLQAIEPFSTLRFMDYLATNGQDSGYFVDDEGKDRWFSAAVKEWDNRKLPNDASQASSIRGYYGGSFEYIVELANLTGKDIWINIPVNASIDYMTKTAKLLKDTLNSNINVYVEYSNEVWNWQFSQTQSNAYYANKDASLFNVYQDRSYVMRYAQRSAEMSNAFKSVFGSNEMNKRIRCVLAWQQNEGNEFDGMMNFLKTRQSTYGDPRDLFYTFSVAPYFQEPSSELCTDISTIQNKMIDNSDGSRNYKIKLVAYAEKWDMKGGVIAYEGGPHYVGDGQTNLEIRKAAHRDPGMKDIVIRDIKNNWFEVGCKGFMYFALSGAYSQHGCWGAAESFENFNTPKYQALLELSNMPLSSLNIFKEPGGLIPNGGFENGLASWTNTFNTKGLYSVTSEEVHTGSNALKLNGQGSSNGFMQSNWVMADNTDYILSFYTKGANSRVSVCNSRTGWDNGYVCETGVNNEWVLKTITFNSRDDQGFFLLLQDRFNGVTYYDDFKLVKAGEATTTQEPTQAVTTSAPSAETATPQVTASPSPTGEITPTASPTQAVTTSAPTAETTTPEVTPTLSPTPEVTATPSSASSPTTQPPTPVKRVYVPVANVSVSKTKGIFKVSANKAGLYKSTTAKKAVLSYKKGKKLRVMSVKGNWAKVTVSKKTYYTKITNLTFTTKQAGKVTKKTKTYVKASSKSKVAKYLSKNKKITIIKRVDSYYLV